jgi:hypothetical protein
MSSHPSHVLLGCRSQDSATSASCVRRSAGAGPTGKRLTFAIAAGLFASSAFAQAPPPALVILAGDTKTLPAGRHEFSSISIAMNGRLEIVPNGPAATTLVVRGNVHLDGRIVAEGASSEERQHTFVLPNGRSITVNYRHTNRGGDGGDGDFWLTNIGGRGAAGTMESGGGGGSGATSTRPGMDAAGRRGGGRVPACGAYGGAGTFRDPYTTGGTLYLEVHGDFFGSAATAFFALKGGNGADGIFGERNQAVSASPACTGAPGGGGGGAPGNAGGHLVVWVGGRISAYPAVFVTGGNGGRAGAGGTRMGNADRAAPGTDGQPGPAGSAQWFGPEASNDAAAEGPVPDPNAIGAPMPQP